MESHEVRIRFGAHFDGYASSAQSRNKSRSYKYVNRLAKPRNGIYAMKVSWFEDMRTSLLNTYDELSRSYNYVNIVAKPRNGMSAMRVSLLEDMRAMLLSTDDELSPISCCTTLFCHSTADNTELRKNMELIIQASNQTRRSFLGSLYSPDNVGSSKYDGNFVCTTFLLQVFKFNHNLQCAAKNARDWK